MFESFTDPIVVVRCVMQGDLPRLQKLLSGGASVGRRTTYAPWMTPMDAACSTKRIDAVEVLLDAGAPIYGSAIFDAIKVDFVAALRAFHKRDATFHQRFRQDAGHRANPRLNRWLTELHALDFALSIEATECAKFLEELGANKHQFAKRHLGGCTAILIREESFLAIASRNVDGVAEMTTGYYCAKCTQFV